MFAKIIPKKHNDGTATRTSLLRVYKNNNQELRSNGESGNT
jgi:hypothetical protein